MKLVINIPAWNEEERIGSTIKRIPRQILGVDEVFIQVTSDGSTDKTLEKSRLAGVDSIYERGIHRGIGVTFRDGVEQALKNGADIMVNLDADGQFEPNDIYKLIQPILSGTADIVSADRFSGPKAKNIPFVKDILNRLAASLIGSFMNVKIKDLTCGFRAYNREALLRLNLPGAFTYVQEAIIDALGKNLIIQWVPVEVTYFADRKSRVVKSILGYVSNSFRIIIRAVRDVRPMKFFGYPGLFLIALSMLVLAIFFFKYFTHDFKVTPFLNYLLFSSVTFLIGMQLLIFAFIADMIKSNRKLTEEGLYLQKIQKYGQSK
ncbi:MAG: glycosyltransferase family 2 protein [Candidatus Moraniibacteriota bacterium]